VGVPCLAIPPARKTEVLFYNSETKRQAMKQEKIQERGCTSIFPKRSRRKKGKTNGEWGEAASREVKSTTTATTTKTMVVMMGGGEEGGRTEDEVAVRQGLEAHARLDARSSMDGWIGWLHPWRRATSTDRGRPSSVHSSDQPARGRRSGSRQSLLRWVPARGRLQGGPGTWKRVSGNASGWPGCSTGGFVRAGPGLGGPQGPAPPPGDVQLGPDWAAPQTVQVEAGSAMDGLPRSLAAASSPAITTPWDSADTGWGACSAGSRRPLLLRRWCWRWHSGRPLAAQSTHHAPGGPITRSWAMSGPARWLRAAHGSQDDGSMAKSKRGCFVRCCGAELN